MRIGVVLLSFMACMVFLSCKKPNDHYITDQRLRDALNFAKGSYFVYMDSATHRLDTTTIVGLNRSMKADDRDGDGDNYEMIDMTLQSTSVGWWSSNFLCGMRYNMNTIKAAFRYNITPPTEFEVVKVLEFPFNEGIKTKWNLTAEEKETEQVAYYDSLSVNGKIHYNVYNTITKSERFEFQCYMSLRSGLVMYTVFANGDLQTCYLQDLKIIR